MAISQPDTLITQNNEMLN
jgi:hypothetical protein